MRMPAATFYPEKLRSAMRRRLPALGAVVILLAIGGLASPSESKARYNDGDYVGEAADTEWGMVQIKAVVRNGSLTDVQFMQYPAHRRRSAEISNWALPILRSEAIRDQSARVDMVSSATITSDGFQQSLASALQRAVQ
jgi:uncharacterized protein with FMN-binding domain